MGRGRATAQRGARVERVGRGGLRRAHDETRDAGRARGPLRRRRPRRDGSDQLPTRDGRPGGYAARPRARDRRVRTERRGTGSRPGPRRPAFKVRRLAVGAVSLAVDLVWPANRSAGVVAGRRPHRCLTGGRLRATREPGPGAHVSGSRHRRARADHRHGIRLVACNRSRTRRWRGLPARLRAAARSSASLVGRRPRRRGPHARGVGAPRRPDGSRAAAPGRAGPGPPGASADRRARPSRAGGRARRATGDRELRADRSRARGPRSRRRRPLQPADRRGAVHQPQDRERPRLEHHLQARGE